MNEMIVFVCLSVVNCVRIEGLIKTFVKTYHSTTIKSDLSDADLEKPCDSMAFSLANSWLHEGTERYELEGDRSSSNECHQSESDNDENAVTDFDKLLTSDE